MSNSHMSTKMHEEAEMIRQVDSFLGNSYGNEWNLVLQCVTLCAVTNVWSYLGGSDHDNVSEQWHFLNWIIFQDKCNEMSCKDASWWRCAFSFM